MSEVWRRNIQSCSTIIRANRGPSLVNVVSGSLSDQEFWQERMSKTRQDVFRKDGQTTILSSLEKSRKGNFLGSINAWMELHKSWQGETLPPVILMNMVFGLGKRLSPFTQALGNRKPAFPTPMHSVCNDIYLTSADIAAMSATLWLNHLETNGFHGMIIKWGDEAIIPGRIWESRSNLYEHVDGIRFVWQTEPTQDLAREKEWVAFDAESLQMTHQYTRQSLDSLHQRLSGRGLNQRVGVNLGSLAISYALMRVAEEVFRVDVFDEKKWVDWDPYTWIALSCQDEDEWKAEAAIEDQTGKTGIRELERRTPDFICKILNLKHIFREHYGRYPAIRVLDFGQPFWMDWGLHLSLRRFLEELTTDSDLGVTSRQLFNLPQERDSHGNILVRSSIPHQADIHDSLLVDTIITDPASLVQGGLVLAGRYRKLVMPYGGSALFCAANEMRFDGPHAIGFRSIGNRLLLAEGERLATLFIGDEWCDMRTNESLVSYEGQNYSASIMGNPISYEEAGRRMSVEDTRLVDKRWFDCWDSWLR